MVSRNFAGWEVMSSFYKCGRRAKSSIMIFEAKSICRKFPGNRRFFHHCLIRFKLAAGKKIWGNAGGIVYDMGDAGESVGIHSKNGIPMAKK